MVSSFSSQFSSQAYRSLKAFASAAVLLCPFPAAVEARATPLAAAEVEVRNVRLSMCPPEMASVFLR